MEMEYLGDKDQAHMGPEYQINYVNTLPKLPLHLTLLYGDLCGITSEINYFHTSFALKFYFWDNPRQDSKLLI